MTLPCWLLSTFLNLFSLHLFLCLPISFAVKLLWLILVEKGLKPDFCRNFLAKKFKTLHGWGSDYYLLEQFLSLCLFLLWILSMLIDSECTINVLCCWSWHFNFFKGYFGYDVRKKKTLDIDLQERQKSLCMVTLTICRTQRSESLNCKQTCSCSNSVWMKERSCCWRR